MLGDGDTFNPGWAPSSNLIGNNLPRVAEGVRQWRRYQEATMIFTGAAGGANPVSNAAVAASLGVPENRMIVLDRPKDTEQDAGAVRGVVGQQPFLLVTFANHMARADVLPCCRARAHSRARQPVGDQLTA
nr:hypothetical protein [Candidatus Pantoea persica]